jgi:hypothetical protein
MGYAIAALILILAIAGFVTFFVLNATKKSGPAAAGDGEAPGIGGDATPLGDTSEHAGEQSRDGVTIGDAEHAVHAEPDAAAHRARPGEAEGGEQLEFEGKRPSARSER